MTAFGRGRGESTGSSDKIDQASSFHTSLAEDKCDLLLEQFIDFDANGHAKRSAKKKRIWAWRILKTTTKHYGLRYESGLLWKTDDQKLPSNYSQRNKICKNEGLKEVFKNVINTYIEYGHASKLTKKEIDNDSSGRTWYNHQHQHPVFNPNKPEKRRVVFDLLAKCPGVCLNDVLLKGPDLPVQKWIIENPCLISPNKSCVSH